MRSAQGALAELGLNTIQSDLSAIPGSQPRDAAQRNGWEIADAAPKAEIP